MASERFIETTYYFHKEVVKITRAAHPENALPNAVRHLLQNDYGATVVEVTDLQYGELLAVATYKIGEKLQIIFEKNPHRPVCIKWEI
jgi:hypothetical protein